MAVGWALQSNFGTVTASINTVLAFSPQGTLEIPAMNVPSFAGTLLGTASGKPGLVCRDEITLGVFAATLSSEHALVLT